MAKGKAKVVVGRLRPGARAKENVVANPLVVGRAVARVLVRALAAPHLAESPKDEVKDRQEELLPRGRHIAALLPLVIVIAPYVMRF